MREQPPRHLTAMLERLGLAGGKDVARVARRVRRLAGDLPRFDSVWVDALAQARVLTPFQAAEINAGRGERLRVGPYLLCASVPWPPYAACYRARHLDSGETVRLVVIDDARERADEISHALETLAEVSNAKELRSEHLAPITATGIDDNRIWAAAPWVEGRTAARWLVHNGRLPPEVVLEIARNMLAGLVDLERAGLCHGDVSTAGLVLQDDGAAVLLQPGLRAILRPEEGYAHADLLPEAYDYLAPERVTDGTPPSTGGDVYACGCVWWHMLCGRAPLSGGNSLAKLRAAQAAEIDDLRRWAPEVPSPLSAAITACVEREPSRRPESMARLAAVLGSPTRCGKRALANCLAQSGRSAARWPLTAPARTRWAAPSRWLAATAVCLMAAAAILWPWWRGGVRAPSTRQGEPVASTSERDHDENRERDLPDAAATHLSRNAGPSEQGHDNPVFPATDGAVVPAYYEAAVSPSDVPRSPSETPPTDLVLGSGGPLSIESLPLRAGQCVRGMPGERPLVVVPPGGLPVEAEDVRFENIDFLWNHRAGAEGTTASDAAIVDLRVGKAEFRGCSFRAARGDATPPAAIRWTHPAARDDSPLSLPSGRVRLADCVIYGLAAGIDCRTVGALAVEISNTLALGGGPLLRLDHAPRQDEPVLISLSQVTLRNGGPLLQCRFGRIEPQPGEISVRSLGCALVPHMDSALILFDGPQPPEPLLGSIRWTGQGSLVSPEATIAAWRGPDGVQTVLDDASISISGVVRSEVGFAGDARSGPAASRIVHWQAPLQSTDPPGADPTNLPAGNAPFDNPPR